MLFFSRLQRQPVYASQVSCPQTSNPQFMVFRYVTLITLWSVLVSTPSKLADVAEGDAGEVLVLPLSSANWKLTPMWLVISDIWTGKTFRPTPWSSSQDPHLMYPFKCQPPTHLQSLQQLLSLCLTECFLLLANLLPVLVAPSPIQVSLTHSKTQHESPAVHLPQTRVPTVKSKNLQICLFQYQQQKVLQEAKRGRINKTLRILTTAENSLSYQPWFCLKFL